MRKILICICAMFVAIISHAQEHMPFKGIPMDCDIETFVSKLETQGYIRLPFGSKHIGPDMVALYGTFAGVEKCIIMVQGTPLSKTVWRVGVLMSIEDSWTILKNNYNSLKDSYTKKYGDPDCFEYFIKPYFDGCGSELQAIELGKSNYTSFFNVKPLGGIVLSITKNKIITISYEDDINTTIFEKEKEEIVSNDI